jgi:hypothetical protein
MSMEPTVASSGLTRFGLAIICATVAIAGCAGRRPPTAQMSAAATRVVAAEDADASRYAPLEMRVAREKLDGAEKAAYDHDNDEAKRLAEESSADAELAQAKADAEKARRTADEMRKAVDALGGS